MKNPPFLFTNLLGVFYVKNTEGTIILPRNLPFLLILLNLIPQVSSYEFILLFMALLSSSNNRLLASNKSVIIL